METFPNRNSLPTTVSALQVDVRDRDGNESRLSVGIFDRNAAFFAESSETYSIALSKNRYIDDPADVLTVLAPRLDTCTEERGCETGTIDINMQRILDSVQGCDVRFDGVFLGEHTETLGQIDSVVSDSENSCYYMGSWRKEQLGEKLKYAESDRECVKRSSFASTFE